MCYPVRQLQRSGPGRLAVGMQLFDGPDDNRPFSSGYPRHRADMGAILHKDNRIDIPQVFAPATHPGFYQW